MAIGRENISSDIAPVDEARFFDCFREILIEESISAQSVAHVHIDHAPRSQHGFFVRVAERSEDSGNAFNAFFDRKAVGSASHCADAFSGSCKDVRVVIFFEGVETLFGYATRHKFFPRLRVNKLGEVVNCQFLIFVLNLCSIYHKGHTNRYAAKN